MKEQAKLGQVRKVGQEFSIQQHVDLIRYQNMKTAVKNGYFRVNLLEVIDQLPQQKMLQFCSPHPQKHAKSQYSQYLDKSTLTSSISSIPEHDLPYQLNPHYVKPAIHYTCDEDGNEISINGYQFSRNSVIGKGAFSVVRLAKKNYNQYAIKIISYQKLKRKGFGSHKKIQEMLNTQIHLLQTLKSSYIITLHQTIYLPSTQSIYLVLEYCNNSLTNTIYKSISAPTIEWQYKARRYMLQIAIAVRQCMFGRYIIVHENNFVHRDIKPENILLSQKDQVRVIDFNLGMRVEGDGEGEVAGFVGTRKYAPPQMLALSTSFLGSTSALKKYNLKKVDIWSLGITYLELLQKWHPFNVSSIADLLKSMSTPIVFDACLSSDLVDLLTKMLKYNNQDRIGIQDVVDHRCFWGIQN